MKVTVTHLKAPWPAGVQVGHVVEFPGDAAPAWAAGKFERAREDAEAAFTWVPPEPEPEPAKDEKASADSNAAMLLDAAQQQLAAAHAERDSLTQQLAAAVAEREAMAAKVADLEAAAAKGKGSK